MKSIVRYFFAIISILSLYPINAFSQKWVKVSAGGEFSAALNSNGKIYTTGTYSNLNQIGQFDPSTTDSFQQVGTDSNWANIATGGYHVLALKTNGTVWSWGGNTRGQCGNGFSGESYIPSEVNSDTDWVYIATGSANSYAIKRNGTLWAWGWNVYGQLADGSDVDSYTPLQVAGNNWQKVAAGREFVIALKKMVHYIVGEILL